VVLHAIGLLYMFAAIATVCDEFFVPALEQLVEAWDINEDVAGATFMAAGGSAPELFTSLMGVFIAKSDVGFGTIIGSAVFNVLFVIGMCAIFSKELLCLTWWPLARDCSFYTLDLVVLYLMFRDGKIEWYEAGILLLLYLAYVTFMAFNETAEGIVKRSLGMDFTASDDVETLKEQPAQNQSADPSDDVERKAPEKRTSVISAGSRGSVVQMYRMKRDVYTGALQVLIRDEITTKGDKAHASEGRKTLTTSKTKTFQKTAMLGAELSKQASTVEEEEVGAGDDGPHKEEAVAEEKEGGAEEEEENEALDLSWPSDGSLGAKINFVIFAPILFSLAYTVPDVRNPDRAHMWPASFTLSILWIGFISYFMVWWALTICQAAGVPDVVMGYTVLAAGTSVPDMLTSVIVAQNGQGDMAVSSSIGSNIFDITLGLPLPWFIWSLSNNNQAYLVEGDSLEFSLMLLILMLVSVVATIALSGWKMTKTLGGIMFALYAVFLMLVLLQEYGYIEGPSL